MDDGTALLIMMKPLQETIDNLREEIDGLYKIIKEKDEKIKSLEDEINEMRGYESGGYS